MSWFSKPPTELSHATRFLSLTSSNVARAISRCWLSTQYEAEKADKALDMLLPAAADTASGRASAGRGLATARLSRNGCGRAAARAPKDRSTKDPRFPKPPTQNDITLTCGARFRSDGASESGAVPLSSKPECPERNND